MATNLRKKIPESDTMIIHDVNPAVTKKFAEEVGNAKIADNVRDVAEQTVCASPRWIFTSPPFQDEPILFYL